MNSPLETFLKRCHDEFLGDTTGDVAEYIPELKKADAAHFGVSLATIDGHIYEVGNSDIPFTIQSISKPFVFALALERLGHEPVEKAISVEPSGEAFNSIRLTADNRPFNPMVNAGAIACSALVYHAEGQRAFNLILETLSSFAGRELTVDSEVYESESATGDRNRAIAWLLHNYGVVKCDVNEALDVYFRQCSILVTARDLAVMAATLANDGVNPMTRERVISPYAVARTLSVMTSSGMYDYAGQWIYRVGIPAKSGVAGGIIASLPTQFGLGTYSPRLDSHGNSVRGIKTCEALSSFFSLHLLDRADDVTTCIIADYAGNGLSSRRDRLPSELNLLEKKGDEIRVIELVGALSFASTDYIGRKVMNRNQPVRFVILDFQRVPSITSAASILLSEIIAKLHENGIKVIFCGCEKTTAFWATIENWAEDQPGLKQFKILEDALVWAEDQVIYQYGGFELHNAAVSLAQQDLFDDLSADEIEEIASLGIERIFKAGENIIAAGSPATSIFFLQKGLASVKLQSGAPLSSLAPGMAFGEMALLEPTRSANVIADTPVLCLELPISAYEKFSEIRPKASAQIMRNLAKLLSRRLRLSNTKVEVLRSR